MPGHASNDLEITLSQKVFRADGTVEDLGVTASTADGSIRIVGDETKPMGFLHQLKERFRA